MVEASVRALYLRSYTVIVDETNLTTSLREKWKRIDPDAQAIEVPTDPAECIRRAYRTKQPYLVDVILRMAPNGWRPFPSSRGGSTTR